MSKKKIIVVVIILVAVLAAGTVYFVVFRGASGNVSQIGSSQTNTQPEQSLATSTAIASSSVVSASATTTFNANDNLDPAMQDLNTVVQ